MIDGWITLDEYCARYGEARGAVHKRVQDGQWQRGEIYSSPDGKTSYVHEARAAAWLRERGKLATAEGAA